MKSIPLNTDEKFKTREILKIVVSQPLPNQGITVDDMRRRCRILEVLEKLEDDSDVMLLEDADHAVLVRLMNGFQFGVADSRLLKVIDDVIGAVEPNTDDA